MSHDARRGSHDSHALLVGAREGFANEPRLLTDACLLGALHAELEAKQPRADAARSLFQMGLLHGLRDALHAEAVLGDHADHGSGGAGAAPLLSIAIDSHPRGTARGEVAILGHWPRAHEAGARIERLGRSTNVVCGLSAGYTAGWYSGLLERDLVAVERSCVARGDADCRFELRDAEAWRERRDPQALSLLEDVPFRTFRELAGQPATPGATPAPEAASARAADKGEPPVVHVWGPVMVIPFSGVEQALRGLDLIGRDPAAREVSVVIVDLKNSILDQAFDAAALELIVSTAQGWGAEALLAGISPLSEQAVADLEQQGVTLYKDLPLAIAAAFQIVRAQRRAV